MGQGARQSRSTTYPATKKIFNYGGYGPSRRVSIASLIVTRPAAVRARLIYRTHVDRDYGKHRRKGLTETDYARLLDGAHQALAG